MTHYWFLSKYTQHSKLALFTFLLAFIVILLGAYTRLTDAGLSCPDWPHCYGYLTAPHTPSQLETAAQNYPHTPVNVKKAWTEMTHRYVAGVEGILILILSFSILFVRKVKNIKSIVIASLLILLLGIQVLLGMLTVTEKLKPIIVLSHLLTGISILSTLWWAYIDLPIRENPTLNTLSEPNQPISMLWLWIAFCVIALQIALGGWVSSHYAGLACVDFPYCNNQLLPILQWRDLNSDLITIHMLHRIGALITFLYLSLLTFLLFKNKNFRIMSIVIFILLILQITLGVLNIIWLRPVFIALTHQAIAILLLLTILTALSKNLFIGKTYAHSIA